MDDDIRIDVFHYPVFVFSWRFALVICSALTTDWAPTVSQRCHTRKPFSANYKTFNPYSLYRWRCSRTTATFFFRLFGRQMNDNSLVVFNVRSMNRLPCLRIRAISSLRRMSLNHKKKKLTLCLSSPCLDFDEGKHQRWKQQQKSEPNSIRVYRITIYFDSLASSSPFCSTAFAGKG